MKFKYKLPEVWTRRIQSMREFANGATQVTIRLRDGREFGEVLISDATYVIAVRGFEDLPFALENIDDVFQGTDDKSPGKLGGWHYWDEW